MGFQISVNMNVFFRLFLIKMESAHRGMEAPGAQPMEMCPGYAPGVSRSQFLGGPGVQIVRLHLGMASLSKELEPVGSE